jgi:hypothetical protein
MLARRVRPLACSRSAEGRGQNLCQPHGFPEAWAGAVIYDRSREVAVRQSWPFQPRCAAWASRSYGTCCSAGAFGRCAAALVCRPVGRLPTSWQIGHPNGTRPPGRSVDSFTVPLYCLSPMWHTRATHVTPPERKQLQGNLSRKSCVWAMPIIGTESRSKQSGTSQLDVSSCGTRVLLRHPYAGAKNLE